MDTSKLKKFAQQARRALLEQVDSKLGLVLQAESAARREAPKAIIELENALAELGKEALVDKVAYIWFNRFCALRFMDVNGYNRVGVVSPAEGQVQPEILAETKAGHIDDTLIDRRSSDHVVGLLNGSIKSKDAQAEAYRRLIVSVCNTYYSLMPYLFQRIDDYTELLMPDDLLSENSVLANTRIAMTAESCESVEVIGWLYQFYISEKKDKVFEDLKKNKKVTAENIPAATQLFTPHWIVRYLVENTLGRLWMLNNPNSGIAEKMDYYIEPLAADEEDESESDFLRISSPEELKICDPAAGSGHMLTYAYDLLYDIYLDAGYNPVDIPELILTKNLYGIEIDERASELAAFALSMKAMKGNSEDHSNNRRRFFRNPIKPNICKLEKILFSDDELSEYFAYVGKDLFTADLRQALKDFEKADNFGSLIRPSIRDVTEVLRTLESKDISGQLFLTETHKKVLRVLRQADYLSQKYHVVVANPPYMGGKGMNPLIATWLKDKYADVKSDLFSAFIVRNTELALSRGQLGFMAPFVWMFISSYEKLRKYLIGHKTITSLVQLEYSGFDGATVPICTFTIENTHQPGYRGGYVRLSDFRGSLNQAPKTLEAIRNPNCGWFYRASAIDFKKIPGSPIAYWFPENIRNSFEKFRALGEIAEPRQGLATTDNNQYLRLWWEPSYKTIGYGLKNLQEAKDSSHKWFPYNKGGEFRRWSGNREFIIDWSNDGEKIKSDVVRKYPYLNGNVGLVLKLSNPYFEEGLTWTATSSSYFGIRHTPSGFLFDVKGSSCFTEKEKLLPLLGFLASCISAYMLKGLNPTIEFQNGNIKTLPVADCFDDYEFLKQSQKIVSSLVASSSNDWDAYETSWDFTTLQLASPEYLVEKLADSYKILRINWQGITDEMKRLEEENNYIFIESYDLKDELSPEVPIEEITLTCNPAYRYGIKISEEEREKRLRADTMVEFLSYAVGCMFGRFSLDEPGLILANQGEGLEDYLARISSPRFLPDEDNVIPMIDFEGDWFEDDITGLFKKFLRVTFGEENFTVNIAFIEESLGKDVRKYFLKDFFSDHVKRYKKRPIYWLFSSDKGTFNALIYMHRYHPDTVSIVLNEYLREFRAKLEARKDSYEYISISASSSQKDKTQALKLIDKINKAIDEVNEYERELLFPLAGQRVEIDLDDGVKHNYPLFGKALKKITGL